MGEQPLSSITTEWLTEKLKARGALQRGKVIRVEMGSETYNRGFIADIVVLQLTYSSDATGVLPQRLLLKRSRADLHPELIGRASHEAKFYKAVATLTDNFPIPICYDVAWDEGGLTAQILIEDLSETHFQKPIPIPPSNRHCEMIIASLGQIHAAWWNSPRLGVDIGERLDMERATAIQRRIENTVPAFFDYLGDGLLPQQRATFESILASNFLARLSQRLCALQDVTLIHGDAHTGNLMLPHDPTRHRVILIDWQLWDINVAAIDLAFLMALHWSPPRRALFELPLLQRYYEQLQAYGVEGYPWQALWNDYRESVIVMCLIPIGQFRRKSPAGVVWYGLQNSLAAFDDLHCTELL